MDGFGLNKLVAVYRDLKTMKETYRELALDVPEDLEAGLSEVLVKINEQVEAQKQAKLMKLKAKRVAISSEEEKAAIMERERARIDAEIAVMEKG